MLAIFSGADWALEDCIEFQEKKRKLLSCFHVHHRAWIEAVSRRIRPVTGKKCTKECAARAKLLLS